MEKKYQVFVSSTYKDLIEERKEATQALLESGCIPAGMELFPASNKQQWDIIKRVIDDCDFYMLIVAGKYGSVTTDEFGKQISYTEKEFDYAVSVQKPIIAFIHNQIESIDSSKIEQRKINKERLDKFKKKVETNRVIKYWNNKDNLKSVILTGIQALIRDEDAVGWVRGSALDEADGKIQALNDELNTANKTIDTLRSQISEMKPISGEASLYSKNWIGSGGPYETFTYELLIPGISVNDKLDIKPTVSRDSAAMKVIFDEWERATVYFLPQEREGVVTFCANEKPFINIPISWRVIK